MKTESKHTRGPWHWGCGPSEVLCQEGIIAADGSAVFVNCGRGAGEPTESDARLIAAAPLMLEALEFAYVRALQTTDQDSELVNKLFAAIAKATGGSQ